MLLEDIITIGDYSIELLGSGLPIYCKNFAHKTAPFAVRAISKESGARTKQMVVSQSMHKPDVSLLDLSPNGH
jgi:hypothetical protein